MPGITTSMTLRDPGEPRWAFRLSRPSIDLVKSLGRHLSSIATFPIPIPAVARGLHHEPDGLAPSFDVSIAADATRGAGEAGLVVEIRGDLDQNFRHQVALGFQRTPFSEGVFAPPCVG